VINREMLTEVRVPALSDRGKGIFCKLGLRAAPEDIAIVSAAVFALADNSAKNWQQVRIALGAVAPTPIRARHAEEAITGRAIEAKIIDDASRLAAEKDAQPITDIRGSAGYRRAMVRVLVQRILAEIADNIKKEARV
jgi:carbon-monoxide dehydrogenase medium subunit